jgi:hypothetical protein
VNRAKTLLAARDFHVTPVISLRSPSLCIADNYYYAE